MKKFLLYHWGVDADESGLTKKVNWKWFFIDVMKLLLLAGGLGILALIFIYLILK